MGANATSKHLTAPFTPRQLLTFNNVCWAISCGAKSLGADSRNAENRHFGVNIIVDDNMWRQLAGSCVCSLYCFMFFLLFWFFLFVCLHSPWNLNCLFPFPLQVSFVTATPNYGAILLTKKVQKLISIALISAPVSKAFTCSLFDTINKEIYKKVDKRQEMYS